MKHAQILALCALMALVLTGMACKPATSFQVIKPAAITLPDHIQVIATIDRSKPRSGFIKALEGAASGELIGQTKEGRERALEALSLSLTRTPRFQVVHTGLEYTGSESATTFTTPLPWDEIELIARRYNADAVLAIELFDTDNRWQITPRVRKVKVDGVEKDETVFDGKLDVRVRC